MTNTTAKAQLLDLLIEPLKGCKGLYVHRQNPVSYTHLTLPTMWYV